GVRELSTACIKIRRIMTSFCCPFTARVDLGRLATVAMKVPKSLALLEDQLHRIAPHLHEKTTVLAGSMTKHISSRDCPARRRALARALLHYCQRATASWNCYSRFSGHKRNWFGNPICGSAIKL